MDLDLEFIQRHGRFRITAWDLFPIIMVNICIACLLVAFILLSATWSASIKIILYVTTIASIFIFNILMLKKLLANISFLNFHNNKSLLENRQLVKHILQLSELHVLESENDVIYSYYSQKVLHGNKLKDVFVLVFTGSVMLNIRNHNEFDILATDDPSKRNIILSFENNFHK